MARASDPELARRAAVAVVAALRAAGHVAYFAGGCVRDELLGLAPTDYDVATDATPDRISALFRRTAQVGAAFGVVLVKPEMPLPPAVPTPVIEVATFRSDGPYSDNRRPDSVTFSDPLADARRRDFTINALFLEPGPRGADGVAGTVIDHVGGRADLAAGVVRAVGDADARLAEDHLRALRAVRFAARLGFSIDAGTADAIRRHARELAGVSRERIGEELRRMLAHPSRALAVALMEDLGLDRPALQGKGGPVGERASALVSVRLVAQIPQNAEFTTALAAWVLDRGIDVRSVQQRGDATGRLRQALVLSNVETDRLRGALDVLAAMSEGWGALGVAGQKRLAARAGFVDGMVLLGARDPGAAAGVRRRVAELEATPGGIAPVPVLDGDQLVAAGWKPGRRFKEVLERVYDEQLEGRIQTTEEALRFAESLGRGGR